VYYLTIALVVKQKPNQAIADPGSRGKSVACKRTTPSAYRLQ
jgi:hypothetical protein